MTKIKLHLGCGTVVVDGWINVDYSLGARLSKIPTFRYFNKKLKLFDVEWKGNIFLHDLTKKLPWKDNSVDYIYCSHTLEHFTKDDGRYLLSEIYRVLKKGGLTRIIVPDLGIIIDKFNKKEIMAEDLVNCLEVFERQTKTTSKIKKIFNKLYQFPHRCMYTEDRLTHIMSEIKFSVTPKKYLESNIESIEEIESEERTKNAIVAEGIK